MRLRPSIWILLCLLLAAGAWLFWRQSSRPVEKISAVNQTAAPERKVITPNFVRTTSASTAPILFPAAFASTNATQASASAAKTNRFAYRLTNTKKTIGELTGDPHAILLANALIDTGAKLNLSIPKNLQSQGDPGAYVVQANGRIDNAFRAMLADAGAQIVSYIPNDAYLVTVSTGGANQLAGEPMVQAVVPYEPYYKLSPSLLEALLANPQNQPLVVSEIKVAAFPDTGDETETALENSGAKIVAQESSPFGEVFTVQNVNDVAAVARMPGVQLIEPFHTRAIANDLARVTLGISTDTTTPTNYLGLSGRKVIVEVNDTGIDATHPDFSVTGSAGSPGTVPPSRVIGDSAQSLTDTDGHGTHVAGIIAGNGSQSRTPVNVGANAQGSVTNADFRGKAPNATLYSVGFLGAPTNNEISDSYLQEIPALTNALISNNSWGYVGDSEYDLAAASYDAAVRDALPQVTGSQPVLFVFAAGNSGGGDNDGGGGSADTVVSPGTAKNVITVGALEQLRQITNIVTDINGNSNAVWQKATDSGDQVAGYSSRGNVGIGTEGAFGRFKPDVVAPGSFVISTRSGQWDEIAYYSPTNFYFNGFSDVVTSNSFNNYLLSLSFFPPNTTFNSNIVEVSIEIVPNANSPIPFPNLPIYVSQTGPPDPANPSTYDFVTFNNEVLIPPDGPSGYLTSIQNGNLFYTILNTNNEPINYDVFTEIAATNQNGNYFTVLSNLNQTLGPYYRYESGTSMATPAVSGVLALIQDYFTNTLNLTPSPALLKAMVINGARAVGSYNLLVTNSINFEGWGLPNLPSILPPGITNQSQKMCSEFFLDQSPTNAMATGDSHMFNVTVANPSAQSLPLRVTLAWTDPPGNPAAAIKLVNNLDLVVSNKDTGAVYFGNDIGAGSTFNSAWNTNNAPNLDSINNVENVFLSSTSGTNFAVTVIGRGVNVNAVSAQTNNAAGNYAPNVVQDFALVISCGEGEVTNAITIKDAGVVSAPTTDQDITYVGVTNTPLFNQFVGASSPLLGTNQVQFGSSNVLVTLGQTNQWHFYVVTNNGMNVSGSISNAPNAAFVTFFPSTLSIPRMGVFEEADPANATRPEADIDLYVASGPSASGLMNLNPVVISNCVNGVQIGASVANVFNGASLGRGGTEFVVDTNSTPGQVYYIGVKSEDQYASEFGFLPVFTSTPFSQIGPNGDETVNGLLLPVNLPGGSPAHPGIGYVFGLAIQPMVIQNVVAMDTIVHQNFGDLIGTLNHNGTSDVLNNHDSLGNPPGPYNFIYDDSVQGQTPGSQPSDGPGSLLNFTGSQAIGPWILTEVNDSLLQTGAVTALTLTIQPHQDLKQPGIDVTLQPGGFFNGFIDVPVGYTNLTVSATNISVEQMPSVPVAIPPLELFVNLGSQPTLADTNEEVLLTNCLIGTFPTGTDPGNSISIGPPLQPGRYFVTVYNPSSSPQTVFILATLKFSASAISTVDFQSSGQTNILDDAVTYSSIFVTNTDIIQDFNVGLCVDHPRISDLVFHLISPDGTRYLLMENRGGTTTNGCGLTLITTNIVNVSATGINNTVTNSFYIGETSGILPISWNFFSIPDEMTVYNNTNGNYTPANLLFDTGLISGTGQTNLSFTTVSGGLTIIMNQFSTPTSGDAWNYMAGNIVTNYLYLAFTEDTNLTTTPIKFAPPPFVPSTNSTVWQNSFEQSGAQIIPISAGQNFSGGWLVQTGSIDLINGYNGSQAYDGNTYLDLDGTGPGEIVTNIATIPGQTYVLNFAYSKNPDGPAHGFPGPPGVQILINNNSLAVLYVNLTNSWSALGWQKTSYIFTANSAVTSLAFRSLDPSSADAGVLLDAVSLNSSPHLYYLPEQDISPINGQSAFGLWQLEIQDDRAGAGLTNTLASWQLEFTFADTNFLNLASPLTNNAPLTNVVPANNISWFLVTVPGNADIATNDLIFASAPVNLLFNQTAPDTNGDFTLLGNSTGGISILSTSSAPTNIIPGSTYFLGVQNMNNFAVTNVIEVTFHLLLSVSSPFAFTQPAQSVTGAGAQLNGMATPNGLPATAWFEWGATTFYGNQTPPVIAGNSFNVVYVTNQIGGLVTNVPYHFRLVVSNALAVVKGFDQILDEANVVAWGANFAGQKIVPPGLSNVVAIAGAYDHSLALKNNGKAVVWGDDTFNQTNVPAALNTNLVAVAGGESYSLALKNSGTVIAWGANIFPGETNVPAGLSNVVMIASGQYSSLALKNDGTVTGWGANISGLTNVPAALSNAVSIAGGSFHNLGIRNDGIVIAWGDDSVGQTDVPVGLTNVVAVAAGGFHSLALKNDGSVVAWGDDSAGQSSVPLGLSNVVAIAAGSLHSLALTPLFNVNSTNPIVLNTPPGVPQTNTILPGAIVYYQIDVPVNADFATNLLLFADAPLNVWFTTNTPPTTNGATVLIANSTNGISILSTTSFPTNIIPGGIYYLGVQNTNSFTVNYGIEVDFHLVTSPPPVISSITYTNPAGKFGFLLQWFAPTNDIFQVQWTGDLTPPVAWNIFSNIITYTGPPTSTNGLFSFFDDGSQFPFGPMRYYRLLLLQVTNTLTLPNQTNYIATMSSLLTVTNMATDSDTNLILTYSLTSSPVTSAVIDTNGTITWTPDPTNAGGEFKFTTIVTDNGAPPLSATNSFTVFVMPFPSISSVSATATNVTLQWTAPSNDLFQVEWTASLMPVIIWTPFPSIITSTTNTFTFTDTNAPLAMKFYRLDWLPLP